MKIKTFSLVGGSHEAGMIDSGDQGTYCLVRDHEAIVDSFIEVAHNYLHAEAGEEEGFYRLKLEALIDKHRG